MRTHQNTPIFDVSGRFLAMKSAETFCRCCHPPSCTSCQRWRPPTHPWTCYRSKTPHWWTEASSPSNDKRVRSAAAVAGDTGGLSALLLLLLPHVCFFEDNYVGQMLQNGNRCAPLFAIDCGTHSQLAPAWTRVRHAQIMQLKGGTLPSKDPFKLPTPPSGSSLRHSRGR